MAVIQMRHGAYADFDPTKMQVAELAVVTSGDPNSSTGKALYVGVGSGTVQRIVDYEDAEDIMATVVSDSVEDFQEAATAIVEVIPDAEAATTAATTAAATANAAAQAATVATGALLVDMGTITGSGSSVTVTKSASGVTAEMVVVRAEFGTPTAQLGALTVTTSAGQVSVSGVISGSTTLKLLLQKATVVSAT